MDVRNGRMTVSLDERTGAVVRVADAVSGLVHLDARQGGVSDGRLFRVVAPSESWSSRFADSHEQAGNVRSDGAGARVRCADLHAHTGEPLGLSAEVSIAPSPLPDEVRFTLRLENHGRATVNEVRFPWLGGWTGLGGPGQDRLALGARTFVNPHMFPTSAGNNYALNHQRASFEYPVRLFAPWVDVSGPGGGLALLNYMPESQNGAFCLDNLAGYGPGLRLAFGWAHFVVLRPGESWESPPVGLAVHAGDWHDTADRYREWFAATQPPALFRPELRRTIGFQNVFFRGFDGTPIRPLEDIAAVAATGRRYGVDHLCVWDAPTLGNYINSGPGDLTDYPPADREALTAGLRQAESEGTRTSALINLRHPHVGLHLHDPALPAQVQRRWDGTARTENWSGSHCHAGLWTKHLGPESYVYSPFSPDHQERVLRLTREYLDLGYTSMFYDQPFEVHPDYGFLDAGHRPEHTHRDAVALIGRVREVLLANDPSAVVIGEELDIFSTSVVDMWMSWFISNPSARTEMELIRYSIPRTMHCWVVDNDPTRATLAFAMGMYLCLMVHGGEGTLADEPALAEHVAALARLRQATADRAALADFRDRRGLMVDTADGLLAYSYESAAGPAVIAAAPGAAAGGTITVDRAAFRSPGGPAGVVHRLDGSATSVSGDVLECRLDADEVLVWTL